MSLAELGLSLRALREKKGYSIDEIAKQLKISARTLKALEEGNEKDMPYSVYAKGFIKAYGKLIDADPIYIENMVIEIFGLTTFEPEEHKKIVIAHPRGSGSFGLLIFFLFLGLMVLAGWYLYNKFLPEINDYLWSETTNLPAISLNSTDILLDNTDKLNLGVLVNQSNKQEVKIEQGSQDVVAQNKQFEEKNNASSILNLNITNATVPNLEKKDSDKKTKAEHDVVSDQNKEASLNKSKNKEQTQKKNVEEQNSVLDLKTQINVQQANSEEKQSIGQRLTVSAIEDCWINATTDGGSKRDFSLRKGQSFMLPFTKTLSVRLGNAQGVKLRLNGKDYLIPEGSGRVRDLIFTAENINKNQQVNQNEEF